MLLHGLFRVLLINARRKWRKYLKRRRKNKKKQKRTIVPLHIKIRLCLCLFITFAAIFNAYVYYRQILRTTSLSYNSLPSSIKELFSLEGYTKCQQYSEARLTLSLYCELAWACFYMVLMFIGLYQFWNFIYYIQMQWELPQIMAYAAYIFLNYYSVYFFQRCTVIFLNFLEFEYGFLDTSFPDEASLSQLYFGRHLLLIVVTIAYSWEGSDLPTTKLRRTKRKGLLRKVWFKCFSLIIYTFIYSQLYLHLDTTELTWENEVNGPYRVHPSYAIPKDIAHDLQTQVVHNNMSSLEFRIINISMMTSHSTLHIYSMGTQMLIPDTTLAGIISKSERGVRGMSELKTVVLHQFVYNHSGVKADFIYRLFSLMLSLISTLACFLIYKTTTRTLIFWKVVGVTDKSMPKPGLTLAFFFVNILGIAFMRVLHPNWTINEYKQEATMEADDYIVKRGFGLSLKSAVIQDALDNMIFPSEDVWYNSLHGSSPDLLTRIARINFSIYKHNASSQCFKNLQRKT